MEKSEHSLCTDEAERGEKKQKTLSRAQQRFVKVRSEKDVVESVVPAGLEPATKRL